MYILYNICIVCAVCVTLYCENEVLFCCRSYQLLSNNLFKIYSCLLKMSRLTRNVYPELKSSSRDGISRLLEAIKRLVAQNLQQ